MSEKKIKYFIIVFIVIVAFALFYFISKSYFQLAPSINSIFEKADNLEKNQKLNDSSIVLYDLNIKKYLNRNFEKETILHFIQLKSTDVEDVAKNLNSKKFNNLELYIITNDTTNFRKLNRSNYDNLPLFYIGIDKCPFEIRDFIYPYTLKIKNHQIEQSFVGDLNMIK